jgi:site-specific DNA-methyltransferase (adenine-specific)
MSGQVAFTLRGRNPDVLTCIANLFSGEVFTPPEFANRMLDTLAEASAPQLAAERWSVRQTVATGMLVPNAIGMSYDPN